MNFNLNLHFKQFSKNLFYDQKSYADLSADIQKCSLALNNFPPDSPVALQLKSPYWAMVALLSCFLNNKLAILISHLETDVMLEKLKTQIHFDFVIKDSFFDQLSSHQNDFLPEINSRNASVVVFSSGTTSTPKGVCLSFQNLYYSALGFSEFFKQQANETSLINLPHHHVGGMMILWRAFFSGGRIVTDFWAPLDFISLVPLQLKRMLEDQAKLAHLKKIRVILIGGAALTPQLSKMAATRGLVLYETYGMSESASLITINGEVLPYRQLKLDDAGFFNVKGETMAHGYFINQSFIPFKHEWFKTNDIGKIAVDGKFQFVERADLVFISGGENINPLLVEEVVKQHPEISDAYLMPISDETWGEIGVLIYEPANPSSFSATELNEQLKIHLKSTLHPYLIPKFFFSTTLKFEGQLKPKRSELKALAEELYLKSIFSYHFLNNIDPLAPVLVLFHGFMGDKEDLLEVTQALRSRYCLLSIDLPGHGSTAIENFHGLDDLLQKLAKFIKLFSDTPSYYGYSMGGRVALQLALTHLAPVQLLLESAGIGASDDVEKKKRLLSDQLLLEGIEQTQVKDFLKKWYSNPFFKNYSAHKNFSKDCEKKSLHDVVQWKKSQNFLSLGAFPLYGEVMAGIKKSHFPIIYLYGEEDQKYKSMALALASAELPMLQTIEVMGAGHNPHKTHPSEITVILTDKLKY